MKLSKEQKILYYAVDPELTIGMLKSGEVWWSYDTESMQQWCDDHDIQTYVADEPGYHFKCMRVLSKPYILYAKGNIWLLDIPLISIVWPRKASVYARSVMKDFFEVLNMYDVATISGGAPWIDTLCHTLSLEYDIPTVMVLGWWLKWYLESKHRHLVERVIDGWWVVLSEFKPDFVPTKRSFPQRNRIVAGLWETVFLPAAWKGSGSLITVDFALQMHTTVYTVPWSIYEPTSEGTNQYLEEGRIAAVVDFASMLDRYFKKKDVQEPTWTQRPEISDEHTQLVAYLQEHRGKPLEYIASMLDKDIWTLLSDITILEMQGIVREMEPGVYVVK